LSVVQISKFYYLNARSIIYFFTSYLSFCSGAILPFPEFSSACNVTLYLLSVNNLIFFPFGHVDGQAPAIEEKTSPGSNQLRSSKKGTEESKPASVQDSHIKRTSEQVHEDYMSNGEEHSVSKFAAVHGPQIQEQTNGHKSGEPIPYLICKDGPEHVGKFLYLEGVEYIMWNT
jgi:hypothetical protein